MRITVWGRVLSAVSGLVLLALGVGLVLMGVGILPAPELAALAQPTQLWQGIVQIVGALLLIVLGIYEISLLIRRSRVKSFILQRTEYGDMSISMNALNNMVQKCVASHQELTVNSTRIHNGRSGIVVELKVTLLSGLNIPLTINALQKQIKQYITSCSGVDVQEVRVMVETDTASMPEPEPAPSVPTEPTAEQTTADEEQHRHESLTEKLFHHTEEPDTYTEAPEVVEEAPTQEPELGPDEAEVEAGPDPVDDETDEPEQEMAAQGEVIADEQ